MEAARTKRPYRMGKRAISTEATRQRIIDVTRELLLEHWYDEVTLREIASIASVALQTVVNHFGTKEGILAAALEEPVPEELMMRNKARPDDIPGALRLLAADYERTGDALIRMLSLEGRVQALQPTIDWGRDLQRKWVENTFPAALAGWRGAEWEHRVDLLVCATDVYTWKLLRRDRGLSQAETAAAIRRLVEALHR